MKTPEVPRKNRGETPQNAMQELKEHIPETPKDTAKIEAFAGLRDQWLTLVQKMKKDIPENNDLRKLVASLIA